MEREEKLDLLKKLHIVNHCHGNVFQDLPVYSRKSLTPSPVTELTLCNLISFPKVWSSVAYCSHGDVKSWGSSVKVAKGRPPGLFSNISHLHFPPLEDLLLYVSKDELDRLHYISQPIVTLRQRQRRAEKSGRTLAHAKSLTPHFPNSCPTRLQVCNSNMEHVAESCQGRVVVAQRHVNMTKYVHRKNEKLATFWGLGGLG